jgi:flagella basal body P-ring formation protein FlgA
MLRRLFHPAVLIALASLLMFTARLVASQEPRPASPHRVAVTTRALARGTVLTADDFVYRDTTSGAAAHPAADTTRVTVGWVTRRTFAAGEVLREPAVEPPVVISANTPVDVVFDDQGVRLTVRGVAARDGSIGERIPVRTELGKRLEATVVAPGRVRID